ncbi:30S ribosomal protein S8 [Patescibacteria group bacterium]|nr:30S ribosomal protein S8 [Patescibacteria group bacterium]MBU1721587.1 30S ribosomal protein S8 [Patescibacteria group bacterium]MBU1901813.1 30S ribosomal protein S8 [Patescibacteria group bacterium]
MFTDPIADMLTRIRNAYMAKKRSVMIPASKTKKRIAEVLQAEGYVGAITVQDGTPAMLVVELKYDGVRPFIQSLIRESKPGHRMYRKADELPRILNDYGIAIVSTSQGIMTNKDAKKKGIGGEVICSLY